MPHTFLSSETSLLVIDVQQRLLGSMPEPQMARCLHATKTLVELAAQVGAPIVYTEQYPKGLGPTEASLLALLQQHDADRVEKVTFDACSAPAFHKHLIGLPKRIVLCGMETHICVHATARELLKRRHEIIIPRDAVISRSPANYDNGLQMMAQLGATIANYETIVFDALKSSTHEAFKKFSQLVR